MYNYNDDSNYNKALFQQKQQQQQRQKKKKENQKNKWAIVKWMGDAAA